MPKRIALISDHASPLAVLGSVDSGGQNVYVAQVARKLAACGHTVDIFTRRYGVALPRVVEWCPNVRVIHVPAGPPQDVRKEELLPYMNDFARWVIGFCRMHGGYDLLHANFFMSGHVARQVREALGTPFVITFHALGHVRRKHQGSADEFPGERVRIEERLVAEADAIVAECPQDKHDLETLYGADLDKLHVVPCGVDRSEFWPLSRRFARQTLGFAPDAMSCGCRKPAPGLLLQAAAQHDVDLAASWMVGDILDDVEAGHRAGCRSVLVDNGNETEWVRAPLRIPDYVARDFTDAAAHVAGARGRRTASNLAEQAR